MKYNNIGRPNIDDAPNWYPGFFSLVPEADLITALKRNCDEVLDLIRQIPPDLENHSYAEGKWTVKQVFIHLCDEERYYSYKAFCYSRRSPVILEIPMGEAYCTDFNANGRTLEDICEEFLTVRNATISLFSSMSEEMLDFKDFPFEINYSARSLGWFAVGHNRHHCNFIRNKYLRLPAK